MYTYICIFTHRQKSSTHQSRALTLPLVSHCRTTFHIQERSFYYFQLKKHNRTTLVRSQMHLPYTTLCCCKTLDRSTQKYSFGLKMHFTSNCRTQKRPQSFRLFFMMTSVTASKTNCTFLVSVAHVKWVYISFVSFLLLRSSN